MKSPKPDGDPRIDVITLSPDHMIDHPAGSYYALWNGPAFLDVGVPTGGFVRFALSSLSPQWTLLADADSRHLPIAARYDGRDLAIRWLPYEGGESPPATKKASRLSDIDYAASLQKLSSTRFQGLMNAAHGIGGWSTYRKR